MPTPSPERFLKRLAVLLGLLLLGFVALFSGQSWQAEKQDQIRQMRTVLALTSRALDGYFVDAETELAELGIELVDGPGLADLPRAQHLMRRFLATHPDVVSVDLLRPDGQLVATTGTERLDGLPNMAANPSFQEFQAAVKPDTRTLLGRALFRPLSQRWVVPLRHVLRDTHGRVQAYVVSARPVDLLRAFWGKAPLSAQWVIGLMRDDGFLLSRDPVPAGLGLDTLYGVARDGPLQRHLVASGLPREGYVEARNALSDTDMANVYGRLEHFPVTLFVATPLSEFRGAWWQRMRVPYLLVALLGLGSYLGYRNTLARQAAVAAQRQQADEALRASEAEQRFLVDHLIAGVVVHAADGTVLRTNPQACRLLGLSEAQLLGKAVIDPDWHFLQEDGAKMPLEDYPAARVIRSREAATDVVGGVVRSDGAGIVWLLCSAYPELDADGGLRRVIVTFVDVSARRSVEQTLARSERRYRLLYENSLDGVLQTTPDGTTLSANPAACAIFGLDEAEICASPRGRFVDLDDPRLEVLLAQRAREGHAQGAITMRRGDGSRFEAEIASVIYTEPSGEVLSSVVVRDVTDRRQAEAALAAQALAERANRAKSEFVARMSHELRTPLNAILGFAEMLQLDARPPLTASQRQQVLHIRRAGEHLLSLINDLLNLSRIESGSMSLEFADVDVLEVVGDAVHEMHGQAQAQGVRIVLDAPAEPAGVVRGDRTRLRQVLLNLLSNAIKYNRPEGLVSVQVRTEATRVCLSVRDSGMGMSAAQIEALFQPFNRLGREDSAIEGTGIGLVITRSLVELMGGRMTVHSEPEVGTEFRVELPLAPIADEPGDAEAGSSQPRAAAPGGIGHVLYIDDDEVNRLLMEGYFERRPGLRLSLAGDGPHGVSLAVETTPDVVMIDMMMPGMNGTQVLAAIRSQDALRQTPCIAVSANAMPQEIADALAAGFDGYVTKPVSVSVLLAEVERALELARQRRQPRARGIE